MALLLKQLEIHGFKSFATPTMFVFDRGITAVIGPNGSGKSNVAEALRWVLGEQGHANLRSRRTEDVIFSGSDKRSQLGMAEVVLTLDNADGDLPLAFSEITVARRAFRSGENQYLINGGRVRLKDVQQLVAPLGQAYTIIGQGLVDAALSQKPEERRGLFEHAAGISGLRLRANEAERSLTETSGNSQRLRDILGELEPRVRSLDRSARLAREYGNVRDQLTTLQRRHYALQWAQSMARVRAAQATLRDTERTHQQREADHARASRGLGELRGEERRIRDAIQTLSDTITTQDRELAAERHRLELHDSRARAATERRADLARARDELVSAREQSLAEAARLDQEAAAIGAHIAALDEDIASRDAAVSVARQERSTIQQQIVAIDQRITQITRALATTEGTLEALAERQQSLRHQATTDAAAVREISQQLDATRATRADHGHTLDRLHAELRAAEQTLAASETALRQSRAAAAAITDRIAAAERDLTLLRARHEVLERTHTSGEGLYAGVRAVLRAVRRGELQLPGLVGTLSETVNVPARYETAIEVALGGHLQDIIVDRWDDARVAIDFLKHANAGRATFQPLDTIRAGRPATLDVRDSGLLGIASELVSYPDRIAPVIQQTLGRVLVATDLDASRRLVQATNGWTIVTLTGEITRPSGSVTGGGRAPESGLLARERERRSLPATIAEQQTALDSFAREATAAATVADRNAAAVGAARDQLEARRRDADVAARELDRLDRETQHLAAQLAERQAQHETALARAQQIAADIDRNRGEMRQLEVERSGLITERDTLATALESRPEGLDEALTTLRADRATASERRRSLTAAAERAREQAAIAARGIATRTDEIARLDAALSDAGDREQIVAAIAAADAHLLASRNTLAPLHGQRETVTASVRTAEVALDVATQALREAERERDRVTLDLARGRDEQVFLAERIRNDLDLADPDELSEVETDDILVDEQEIARLRERLRRMSAVGEDVLEQYENSPQRLAFLTRELDDVERAADGLRSVLSDLNASMAARFNETFRDVAVAFEHTFTRLFGGGSARLVLGGTDDGSAGIDIVAQPPGKRLQNLNALSGGERTLTAVALLIAIQRVNPSPFCLLDEVDAALDESNVLRFRDELRDLAGTTQFVVITHNRGTIEGADTLYGVTMGDDSVSRVLSLRLDEAVRAVETYEAAQTADD